jgi:NAD+ synthase (glutamine-hydrolysing)
MKNRDFLRITAVSPKMVVADPAANRAFIAAEIERHNDSEVLLFPELCLTGYTCGELFLQDQLLDAALTELTWLVNQMSAHSGLVIVGLPVRIEGRLYNCAAAFQNGSLLGLVPKQFLPNYQEFYEARWFHPGDSTLLSEMDLSRYSPDFQHIPFGVDLLFESGPARVGIEICEDLWMPIPPSSRQTLAGANILLNLSASNETIGKADYRRSLVQTQSGRCIAAYAYASSGPDESSTDLVFGGHCLIAECGSHLGESDRVGSGLSQKESQNFVTADVDLQRIQHDRQLVGTLHQEPVGDDFRIVEFRLSEPPRGLQRHVPAQPFVPSNPETLAQRCEEIFEIQSAALAQRLRQFPENFDVFIGVSGGLDSTLALLVAVDTYDRLGWDRSHIHGITMPGFGTSTHTLTNSRKLMDVLAIGQETIDIRPLCMQSFADLSHAPFGIEIGDLDAPALQTRLEALDQSDRHDLVFENVQARIRTFLLMSRGFVLGTGDMSEMALGWCTYNADHISMYNVNCSIPKTLVRFLVEYVAEHKFSGDTTNCLLSIASTPISPELLPLSSEQEIQQSTEDTLGPYELHDFFLYHFVRSGASPEKILFLAEHAKFSQPYTPSTIKKTLEKFLQRFFASQYKRSCVPDGPKVGSVSLSPRGDWRMPSDASVAAWEIE